MALNKMQLRMKARTQFTSKGNYVESDGENKLMEEEEEVEGVEKKWQSICNVSFSNFDLAYLINGWQEDLVELRPFNFHFTKERIIKTWKAVGFLPMTGNATNDPKMRYEM